jgi:putative ABC transport system permease protein
MRIEHWRYTIPLRLRSLFGRRRVEEELNEELQSHIDQKAEQYIAQGMSAEEARRAALRDMDGLDQHKEECRDLRGVFFIEDFLKDVRFGLRQLRRNPGFTIVAVITLALGIGANTAIFSYVDAVILRPLPYPYPEQIVLVREQSRDEGWSEISAPDFIDWEHENTVFTAMAVENWGRKTLTNARVPEDLRYDAVTPDYFKVFGIKPFLGRTFAPDEDQQGKQHVVILKHRTWQDLFGADPKIIGRSIHLNRVAYTVIGVMPAYPSDGERTDIWIPLTFAPHEMARNYRWLFPWARLKPGVSLEQARQQMNAIAARIARHYPNSNRGWTVQIERYEDIRVDESLQQSLYILMAAVGAVLLIGCVNIANLLLARGADREHELAIRSALGAGRRRLICQLLTESVVLAGVGGAGGLALGWAMMKVLLVSMPPSLFATEARVQLDHQVLLFAASLIIISGVLFGIVPALRNTPRNLVGWLKEGGARATSGTRDRQARNALVIAEVALAFVLLSGAGLLIRSFYHLQEIQLGFDPKNVLTMNLPAAWEEKTAGSQISNYQQRLLEKVRAVPGVRDAAITDALPLQGWAISMPFSIAGRAPVSTSGRPVCGLKRVSASYLATLGLRLLRGRWIRNTDTANSAPAAVINATMAKDYFKGQDPIGRRILIRRIMDRLSSSVAPVLGQPLGTKVAWRVVGVVADEREGQPQSPDPVLYVSYKQSPTAVTSLAVRGAIDSGGLVKPVEAAIWQLNKNQPFDSVETLEQQVSDSFNRIRLQAGLLTSFAGLAVLLAAFGIYGVISYSASQRSHEIGIRAALGARRSELVRLMLRGGILLTAIGLGIGLLAALGLTQLLGSLLYGVKPTDPLNLVFVSLVLGGVALVATYIPARRAAKVDPAVALRHE